jgi:PAS domain S-box-containing protein
MKADAALFEDIFRVDSASGRISLGNDRCIVLRSDAFCAMRREFIENLGLEAAKAVFQRIGYECGRHDAQQMSKRFSFPSDRDWLQAGLRLNYMEGMAKTDIEGLEIARDENRLRIEGKWLDSFEAELHLRQFGTGSGTACWILEGYSSGYASEVFGEGVICMESHCRAKGDPACRFAIKSSADWGNAGRPFRQMLRPGHFTDQIGRCLRLIGDKGCELEQTSPDAVITTDARGFITSCSQRAGEMLGISANEILGKNVSSFMGSDSEARAIMRRLREQKRFQNYLTDLVSPTGRKTPISLSASAILNKAGEITGTVSVAHDLTEIRQLEDELAKKNRFMANILRDSADAIITMDPNDIITSWNKGAESIFGYSSAEMINKSVEIIVPAELREQHELQSISRKFWSQGAVRSYQTERITKDGRRIQVIFTRTAIRDDSGQVVGSSSVLKDVTAYKSLEKQLVDAEHLATLGELSAGLAHEIKNPLAGIKGAIDVIQDSLPLSDTHREILGDVIHEVNRIDKIVRDLLNYAKPKPPSLSTIDLPELVHHVVALVRKSSKQGPLPIQVMQLTPVPEFTGDETQLEQVLLNLLLNAQNAISEPGQIEVLLCYDSDAATVRMEVSDTGSGIPEELRKRIFQPFFTTRTDGAGLGLATCLKNVQYHGGSIEVRSEVGHGTTFVVSIPLLCHI